MAREAVNVPNELARNALVEGLAKMRADAVAMRASTLAWNAANPHRAPIGTEFEDAVIAWCDGVALAEKSPAESAMRMPRTVRVSVLIWAMLAMGRFATGAAKGANDPEVGKTVIAFMASAFCCWLYVWMTDDTPPQR